MAALQDFVADGSSPNGRVPLPETRARYVGVDEFTPRIMMGHKLQDEKVHMAGDDAAVSIGLTLRLLIATHACRSADFTGVGVVVYVPPLDFPAVPLGGWASSRPELPVIGSAAISETLAKLSAQCSPWHDGFHFIDSSAEALTHVSQFLAPSLEHVIKDSPGELPAGARQLSALLASTFRGVLCVGLLTADQHISIYHGGRLMKRTPVNLA